MNSRPLFTVCIPAYNRAGLLKPLLDSVLSQNFENFDILICEVDSPERSAISSVVQGF